MRSYPENEKGYLNIGLNMNTTVIERIQELKKEKNAIILAHYYAPASVQELADYVGDSYYLAKVAAGTDASVIVFCGVQFMGESVKILNPDKKVLMPDLTADCAMAHMADGETIAKMREEYEDLAVVCYINSTAELKTMSDVCVTSSNAVKIVDSLPNKNIFFIPDRNLGSFVAEKLPHKNIILNNGCCPVHAELSAKTVAAEKAAYPNAEVLSHPECAPAVLELSDFIGSTADIIKYANESDKDEFIICTESGVGYELGKKNPDKKFHFAGGEILCADMKLNTPEKVLHVLETEENQVEVDVNTRKMALKPLEKMLELAK